MIAASHELGVELAENLHARLAQKLEPHAGALAALAGEEDGEPSFSGRGEGHEMAQRLLQLGIPLSGIPGLDEQAAPEGEGGARDGLRVSQVQVGKGRIVFQMLGQAAGVVAQSSGSLSR